jgi:hypothetical protein
MKKNEMANFTHPVPPNSLGYFAQHSRENVPVEPNAVLAMINGPLTAMQPKLTAELAKRDDRQKEAV